MTKPLPSDPRQRAKRQAWDYLSKALRLEAADDGGYCTCVTCETVHHWKEMDAGHWIGGRRESILFEEDAIHCQCLKCNRYHHGNPFGVTGKQRSVDAAYNTYMFDHYGQDRMDELLKRNQKSKTHMLAELLEMIDGYKVRIQAAKKAKGL